MSLKVESISSGQIITSDCIEGLQSLQKASARLVVADPPYYQVLREAWDNQWKNENEYLDWSEAWITAAMATLVDGGLAYIFGQPGKREQAFLQLMARGSKLWEFHDLIIWDRIVGYNDRRDSFTPAYEMILVLRKPGEVFFDKDAVREPYDEKTRIKYAKDKRYKNPESRALHLQRGKYATNLWRIPSLKGTSSEKVGHPSQKPEALVNRILRSSSARGDLVIDPFLGSGTTAIVAENEGRRWIGIENDESFVEISRQRLNQLAVTR